MTSITLNLEPNVDGSSSYYPGHILNATVELKLESTKKVRGFYVQIYGKGKCQWREGSGRSSRTYTGKEVFVHSRTYLLGKYEGPTFALKTGTYKYKFSGKLPYQLPYSLELTRGKISYCAEAVLDIPFKSDKSAKVEITVLRYDDLNFHPKLRMPLRVTEIKKFTALFNESGPLNMSATIPYQGFAINHCAPVIIEYENNSSVDIIYTKLRIMQLTIYNCPILSETKIKEKVIMENRFEGVQGRSSKTIQAGFMIPKVMTSNEHLSQIVIISYFIEVEAETSGIHSNPKISLPVTIGNVPIIFNDQIEDPQMMEASVA